MMSTLFFRFKVNYSHADNKHHKRALNELTNLIIESLLNRCEW